MRNKVRNMYKSLTGGRKRTERRKGRKTERKERKMVQGVGEAEYRSVTTECGVWNGARSAVRKQSVPLHPPPPQESDVPALWLIEKEVRRIPPLGCVLPLRGASDKIPLLVPVHGHCPMAPKSCVRFRSPSILRGSGVSDS
jgi:hypothetical protein